MNHQLKPLVCVRRHPDPKTRSKLIEIVPAGAPADDLIACEEIAYVFSASAGSEREAYAQAMAAAPEMLEALTKAVTWGEVLAREMGIDVATSSGPLATDIGKCHSIIARAEGRTP